MLLVNVIELSKNSLNRECVYTFYIIYFILYITFITTDDLTKQAISSLFMWWHTEEVWTKIIFLC